MRISDWSSDVCSSDLLDASLLLLQEIGFVAADDPRFLGTLDAIGKQLRRGNHLMRYVAPDDFGEPHTAFSICTFWYIDALAVAGRRDEAREIFETIDRKSTRLNSSH